VGAAALAINAIIRSVAHYASLSPEVQRVAGMNGLVLSLLACIAMFISTVQWFRKVVHLQKDSDSRKGIR
jgi:TRAP-type C4-dicarboxylate transport system permease small subunit